MFGRAHRKWRWAGHTRTPLWHLDQWSKCVKAYRARRLPRSPTLALNRPIRAFAEFPTWGADCLCSSVAGEGCGGGGRPAEGVGDGSSQTSPGPRTFSLNRAQSAVSSPAVLPGQAGLPVFLPGLPSALSPPHPLPPTLLTLLEGVLNPLLLPLCISK